MKEVTYKCNVCSDRYSDKLPGINNSIKAIYFISNKAFEVRDLPQDCDTHVCNKCIDSFKKHFESVT